MSRTTSEGIVVHESGDPTYVLSLGLPTADTVNAAVAGVRGVASQAQDVAAAAAAQAATEAAAAQQAAQAAADAVAGIDPGALAEFHGVAATIEQARDAATTAAQAAADAAALVEAPASAAIDAHLGGDSTGLVDQVAAKVTQRPDIADLRDVAPDADLSGVANSRTEIQAALDALPDGSRLTIPAGAVLNVTAPSATGSVGVTVGKRVDIDGRGATILAKSNKPGFGMGPAASGSTFTGFTMVGLQPTYANSGTNAAFEIAGTPGGDRVKDLRFSDITVREFGNGAWRAKHTENFSARDCTVRSCGYFGWQFFSALGTNLWNPTVDGIAGTPANGYMQSYPIAFTRDQLQGDIGLYPNCRDGWVWGGTIKNTGWEGVETHGGININVIGTRVIGCYHGVAFVPCPDTTGTDRWAPTNCSAIGCDIDSGVSDGSKGAGIKLIGCGSAGSRVMPATGLIMGNTVTGHGAGKRTDGGSGDPSTLGAAVQIYQTDGVDISNNRLLEPNPFGIALWYDNTQCSIGPNTVVDAWSDTFTVPAAVAVRSTGNDLSLGAVRLRAGSKTAPNKNAAGMYVSNNNNQVRFTGGHDFTAAAQPFYGGSTTLRWSGVGKNPVALPTLGAGATTSDIVAALKTLGLAL